MKEKDSNVSLKTSLSILLSLFRVLYVVKLSSLNTGHYELNCVPRVYYRSALIHMVAYVSNENLHRSMIVKMYSNAPYHKTELQS